MVVEKNGPGTVVEGLNRTLKVLERFHIQSSA